MVKFFRGSRILILGAGSFIGSNLIRQALDMGALVTGIDIAEDRVFWLNQHYKENDNFDCYIGDVANIDSIKHVVTDVDYCFYLAAFKHVGLNEANPINAINVNALSIVSTMRFCDEIGVKKFIYASSDKAVNPTNGMGATKLLGEKIVCAFNGKMQASVVRFGNVINSPGALLEIIKGKLSANQEFHLRGEETSRFFMTPNETIRLILAAMKIGSGRDIFVMKMKSAKIIDFVNAAFSFFEAKVPIKISQLDTGEKPFEETVSAAEFPAVVEFDDFFVIDEQRRSMHKSIKPEILDNTNSLKSPSLTILEIKEMIEDSLNSAEKD